MKPFDAIFILGGWLVQNPDKTWRTTTFEENNPQDAFGDRLRLEAVLPLISSTHPFPAIIVSGSAGKLAERDAPPVAEVMAHELIQLGIPPHHILKDLESGTTYEQLQKLNSLIKHHHWQQVIILSNAYHLDRIHAIITYAQPLFILADMLRNQQLVLKSAEDILSAHLPEEKGQFSKAYTYPHILKIISNEQQGIKDIQEGRYRFSPLLLRRANAEDADFLFQLRNEQEVRAASWNTEAISYEEHRHWFEQSLANPLRIILIVEVNGNPVGQIRYDIDGTAKNAEVSIAFLPEQRGKGLGTEALVRSAQAIFAQFQNIRKLYAHIKSGNLGSANSFLKAGYTQTETENYKGHACIELIKTKLRSGLSDRKS